MAVREEGGTRLENSFESMSSVDNEDILNLREAFLLINLEQFERK